MQRRLHQQGSLTHVWADKGSRPRASRDQRYDWAYLFGAVCPARGIGAALVLPSVNTSAMNLHLAELSSQVTPSAHAVVTCDGAGWRQAGGQLALPDNISILRLPPYSPELKPSRTSGSSCDRTISSSRCSCIFTTMPGCNRAWSIRPRPPKPASSARPSAMPGRMTRSRNVPYPG